MLSRYNCEDVLPDFRSQGNEQTIARLRLAHVQQSHDVFVCFWRGTIDGAIVSLGLWLSGSCQLSTHPPSCKGEPRDCCVVGPRSPALLLALLLLLYTGVLCAAAA